MVCAFLLAALPLTRSASPAAASAISFPGGLPATFTGTLPCADCPGTRHQLNLFADGVFYHRIAYIDRKTSFDQIGRWRLSDDGKILELTEPTLFAVVDATTLRQLDREGKPIVSTLNFDLRRQPAFSFFEPRLHMDGMYGETKDEGRFTECLTGWEMPVARKKAYRDLKAVYAKAAAKPGEPLLVSIDGRLVTRRKTRGHDRENEVLVEKLIAVRPGEVCPPSRFQ